MKILTKWPFFLFLVLIIGVFTTGCNMFSKKPETEESVKQKVVNYLISEGYKENEFHVDVEYQSTGASKMGGPYAIQVKFNDERNVVYYYKYDYQSKNKDITQYGVAPMKGKEDKNFKHLE
ncbi:DUF3139 domain-containing protein [Bacillus sp. FJAT-49736]|uniref:DUF3139 domain-containing protein n=1 Tax=Bacillus sp. FJAT-49736 TaxID=2833582 RepID=UPI001BC9DF3C|nr:DUF3139 domain-containing protein [Bacillus sp. FJAT-49736]MBS4171748.1 DUF3139 domain-containing protein [Bacillus sp. FJAT-49736]